MSCSVMMYACPFRAEVRRLITDAASLGVVERKDKKNWGNEKLLRASAGSQICALQPSEKKKIGGTKGMGEESLAWLGKGDSKPPDQKRVDNIKSALNNTCAEIRLVSSRGIRKGEEITIHYGEMELSTFAVNYGFIPPQTELAVAAPRNSIASVPA